MNAMGKTESNAAFAIQIESHQMNAMGKTESNAAFAIQIESHQILDDLVYAKKRLERILAVMNEPDIPEENKYKAIVDLVWETVDCLDWDPI